MFKPCRTAEGILTAGGCDPHGRFLDRLALARAANVSHPASETGSVHMYDSILAPVLGANPGVADSGVPPSGHDLELCQKRNAIAYTHLATCVCFLGLLGWRPP